MALGGGCEICPAGDGTAAAESYMGLVERGGLIPGLRSKNARGRRARPASQGIPCSLLSACSRHGLQGPTRPRPRLPLLAKSTASRSSRRLSRREGLRARTGPSGLSAAAPAPRFPSRGKRARRANSCHLACAPCASDHDALVGRTLPRLLAGSVPHRTRSPSNTSFLSSARSSVVASRRRSDEFTHTVRHAVAETKGYGGAGFARHGSR